MPNNIIGKIREKSRLFFWHGFWTDPVIFFVIVSSFLLNLALWGITAFFFRPSDVPVILHFNVFFGVDAIGGWKSVYLMPFSSSLLLAIDLLLSRFFFYKEKLASYLFAIMALLAQLLMAIGIVSIVMINY